MSQHHIKSAHEVVNDFLESLADTPNLDSRTVSAISDLQTAGRLTPKSLQTALDKIRRDNLPKNPPSQNKGTNTND